MRFYSTYLLAALALFSAREIRAQSLLENGKFNNPGDPLKGWVSDYAFTGNSYYINNKDHVSVTTEGSNGSVVKFTDAGVGGVKLESHPVPLEPGNRYTCSLQIKGGGYRLYMSGYQWAPGVHPHDNPEIGELRQVYMSKPVVGQSASWKTEHMDLPGVKLSPEAMEHLKKVKFITVYIFMAKPGFVGNVQLTKTPDPAMNFPTE